MSEKTEKPTRKRKSDARREGQVIKSYEITAGIQLAAMLFFWHFFAEKVLENIFEMIIFSIKIINQPFIFALKKIFNVIFYSVLLILIIFSSILLISTVASIILQVGIVIASKALNIKGQRINPINNFKEIFSVRNLIELCKLIGKVFVLTLIFIGSLYSYARIFQIMPFYNSRYAILLFSNLIQRIWIGLILFYIFLGTLDYVFQMYHTLKKQRMSKEEIKQEYKETEGDPYIKQRRYEMQREIQSGSLAYNIKRSTVIICNPTCIAICLGYHHQTMPVPRVLDKGIEERASLIIKIAKRVAIPIVENVPLAKSLFQHVICGDKIPESMFEQVAALLRIVLKINYEYNKNVSS